MINDYMAVQRDSKMPIRKKMKKLGTLKIGTVETTPVVWEDELIMFEWVRSDHWGNGGHESRKIGYYQFFDIKTNTPKSAPFAHEHAFGCCYAENGIMYAHGVRGNGGQTKFVDVFWSKDLKNWESKLALELPEELKVYNTSVCKGKDDTYVMAVEVSGPEKLIGKNYTILFATSKNLLDWELLPFDTYNYTPDRYSACPSIRYFDGMYYMVYLEELPCYRCHPYIVRSSDLYSWDIALYNPFMTYDDNDKLFAFEERFSDEDKERILNAVDLNNSDVDFCEYNGKTYILYSWGNQLGQEYLAWAQYDGTLEEFLKSFF